MAVLPAHVVLARRTPEFTADTIPPGLLRRHTTKPGEWARIVVLEGHLRFRVLEPAVVDTVLTVDVAGIVEPTVPHEVAPDGPVRFFVEFHAEPPSQPRRA